jgi:subtilisin family serine protease
MHARTSILAAVLAAAIAAAATVVAPSAAAPLHDHPIAKRSQSPTRAAASRPRPNGGMTWFRWHRAAGPRGSQTSRFGSSVVIGLESMQDLALLRARYGFSRARPIPALRAATVSIDRKHLRVLLDEGPADPRLRYVSPLGPPRTVMGMPNDPLVQSFDPSTGQPYEWQFTASHVERALDHTAGDPSIVVGIIDSGVRVVPDLEGKVDGLWSVAPHGPVTSNALSTGNDDTGHGTAVASLIAANLGDGFGMAGFGGAAHVIAIHAGYEGFFDDTAIAIALMKLDSLGVRIVNMSLGGPAPSQPIMVDAIHKAAADGILLVAASGNAHGDVSWPAAALQPSGGGRSFGLAVGASNIDGRLADFSNAGKHLSLVAPGASGDTCSGVLVALPPTNMFEGSYCFPQLAQAGEARYGYLRGTSFAAPEVSGVAALIWAARPTLSNYQVADIIKQSARRNTGSDWNPNVGCGVLDAGAALDLAMSRSAAEWSARSTSTDAVCSVDGARPAAWPSEASQTIRFAKLRNRITGDPDFKVSATASSGLPVSFAASGTCTMRRATVHITGIGVCAVVASQAGNANYNPARSVTRTFSITKTVRARASAAQS